MDYLLKEDDTVISDPTADIENGQKKAQVIRKRTIGMIICIGGIVCLIAWGLVSVLLPSTSSQIGESSMITIDGNGLFLIICLAAIIAGAVLLLKSISNK